MSISMSFRIACSANGGTFSDVSDLVQARLLLLGFEQ
jgi:hypothetical protein